MRLLTLSLITAVLAATIGLGWLLDNLFYQFSFENEDQSLHINTLEEVGQNLAVTLNRQQDPAAFILDWPKQSHLTIQYIKRDYIQFPQSLITQAKSGVPLLLTDEKHISLYYLLTTHNAWLVLKSEVVELESNYTKLALTLLFYAALILLIWLWTYPLVSRLITLRNTAQQFGKGQFDQRINVGGISYVRDLEIEFNQMAQRIVNLVNDVKLIGSAVSHDMRTPLARMRFGIDTIADEDDPEQQQRYLQRLGKDVDEMTKLVELLLDYSRLDQAMVNVEKKQVLVSSLVKECITNKQSDDRVITFNGNDDLVVIGDDKYLMILINNLLQNALNYAQHKVNVSLVQNQNQICLTVSDDGDGFADDHQQMLKPFVRGQQSEQKVKGYGMGLAIVNRIVQWHKGDLSISRCEVLTGAKVVVCLPAK